MASDRQQSDGNRAAPANGPPAKPIRPMPTRVIAEEEPTARVFLKEPPFSLEALVASHPVEVSSAPAQVSPPPPPPLPPPLPVVTAPSDQTPAVALEIPKLHAANLRRFLAHRYARIGIGIFGAGVLVGVIGAVTVMMGGNEPPPEATNLAPAAPVVPKAAALAPPPAPLTPPAPVVEPPAKHEERAEPQAEAAVTAPAEPKNRKGPDLPISGTIVLSCREIFGKSLFERRDPAGAARETRRANRELVLGNPAEAQSALCKAIAWDRSNVERHINLGKLFLVRRDWKKALEYGQSALKLDPKSRRALGIVSDALAALNRTDEARTALLASERKPNASEGELRAIARRDMALAKRVERLRDFSAAGRLYRRVLLLEPDNADAMIGIAGCLNRAGDYKAAQAWARLAKTQRQAAS